MRANVCERSCVCMHVWCESVYVVYGCAYVHSCVCDICVVFRPTQIGQTKHDYTIIRLALFVKCLNSQAKANTQKSSQLWQPDHGTRDEWLRCHGVPCKQWDRTKRKLIQLKMLALNDGKASDYSAIKHQVCSIFQITII